MTTPRKNKITGLIKIVETSKNGFVVKRGGKPLHLGEMDRESAEAYAEMMGGTDTYAVGEEE